VGATDAHVHVFDRRRHPYARQRRRILVDTPADLFGFG
jgi:predicted TIM-barrel fold metal-dependent hydrolase